MQFAFRKPAGLLAVALALGSACATLAQPQMSEAEARLLYAAGGFPISADGKGPLNRCGRAANPKIAFVDINSDQRPDALFTDSGSCYGADRRWFSMAVREADGSWRAIGGYPGAADAVGVSPAGWFIIDWTSNGRTQRLEYNGRSYDLPGAAPALASTEADSPAAPAAAPPANDEEAILRAAGFSRRPDGWESGNCEAPHELSYSPGIVERQGDFNGDGRPDAIVTESGGMCYGLTGQASWLMSRQADGSWKEMLVETANIEFLDRRGVDGWPDISLGGPGFCFPVVRWNGTSYERIGFAYEGKPCRPPAP